jgi:hypothetical protein
MEKIFTPNRWFVAFCALLILVVGALKVVGDMHLAEEAKQVALNIFTYDWAELGVASRVQSINAHVINRNDHDALVEVSGRQMIAKLAAPVKVAEPASENAAGSNATATGATAPGGAAANKAGTPAIDVAAGTPAIDGAAKPATDAAAKPAPDAAAKSTTPEPAANSQPENAEFKANLTFYRANNGWELGKVEQLN